MSKFQKDSTSVGKVMVAFLKHSKLCNSQQAVLFHEWVGNEKTQLNSDVQWTTGILFVFSVTQSDFLEKFSQTKQRFLRVLLQKCWGFTTGFYGELHFQDDHTESHVDQPCITIS